MKRNKVVFHQDNAPCNRSMKTMIKINKSLPYSPYSLDFVPRPHLGRMKTPIMQPNIHGSPRKVEVLRKENYVDE